jgi:hypothetical protein
MFKQARKNVSIDGTIIRKRALDIAVHLGVDSFMGSSGQIERFKET